MEKARDFTTPLERRIAVQEMGDLTPTSLILIALGRREG
jgi:hypothetical protein